MRNISTDFLLTMCLSPKHLKLIAGGGLSGNFVNNPAEGYRTLVPIKTTQNPSIQTPIKQGGASVFLCIYAWL
jgi:hypothetical protein